MNRISYELLNPIIQNNKYIVYLQKITPYNYVNHALFSNRTEIDSYKYKVSDYRNFVENISNKKIYINQTYS